MPEPTPGPPGFPAYQQYFTLTLTFGGGGDDRGRLSLNGPKIPGIGGSAAIGVGKDKDGNYHFLVGSGDKLFRADDLPAEIRKMFGDKSGGSGPPPVQMIVPSKSALTRSDGSPRSYDDYVRDRRLFHMPHTAGKGGTVWPELSKPMYEFILDLYFDRAPLPPPPVRYGPGDYSVPTGPDRYA